MSHKKTNIWIIITALLLIFIFTSLVDVRSLGSFTVELRDDTGTYVVATTLPERILSDLDDSLKVYKQFSVTTKGKASRMYFDVNNNWMEISEISPESLALFSWNETQENWTVLPLTLESKYAVTTLYSAELVVSTPLMIVGMTGTAPQSSEMSLFTRSFIVGGIIIILLIIAHYNPKNNVLKKKKLNSTLANLDAYVKKSLIEGHSEEEIKSALTASGWEEKVIDNAIRRLRYF